MYPVKNGWSGICFGSNANGIHRATLDNPMHYLDGGSFLYLAQVTCLSMTEKERHKMEHVIKSYFQSKRSSVRQELPRAKFLSGFTRTTLLTAGEKIGLILSLYVAIGTPRGRAIIDRVIARTQQKYLSGVGLGNDLPRRNDIYFFSDLCRAQRATKITSPEEANVRFLDHTATGVQELLLSLREHDLYFVVDNIIRTKDELQFEYLLQAVNSCLYTSIRDGFPGSHIASVYSAAATRLRTPSRNGRVPSVSSDTKIFLNFLRQPKTNTNLNYDTTEDLDTSDVETSDGGLVDDDDDDETCGRQAKKQKTFHIRNEIPKHGLVKPRVKGNGATSAILTDCDGYLRLFEKILAFHSFVHYFRTVDVAQ
jgi:hypothetical protein